MPTRFLAVLLLVAACHKGPRVEVDPSRPSLDPQRLTEVLKAEFLASADDWNAGNLQAFMSTYADDSSTAFRSGPGFQHGYGWIRDHYAPLFVPGASRDSLRFEDFTARPLGTTYALVTARYVLYRNGVTTSSGPFSLVMQEQVSGWKIILDHTSSDAR